MCKTCVFRDSTDSPKWVTKIPFTRFWKFTLSLFLDWDFYSPVSREPFWVTSRLDFHSWSSRENELRKWKKPRFFEKFSKYFSRLEVSLGKETRNLLCNLAIRASRLAWLTSESSKGKVENFWIVVKKFEKKHSPKTTKIFKNLFVFD